MSGQIRPYRRPGVWLLNAIRVLGARWLYATVGYLAPVAFAATGVWLGLSKASTNPEASTKPWLLGLFVASAAATALWRYLADCEPIAIREQYWHLKGNMAGNVARIASLVLCRSRRNSNRTEFIERCRSLQSQILRTIVDDVSDTTRAHHGQITANWMVPSGGKLVLKEFALHNDVSRRYIELPLDGELPGAPEAFHQQEIVLIPDIQAEQYLDHFRSDAPYRCILSIPVYLSASDTLGVVNIDSTRPNHLHKGLAKDVQDGIYLVGLLEQLKDREKRERGQNKNNRSVVTRGTMEKEEVET